jgi:hypothetical protein
LYKRTEIDKSCQEKINGIPERKEKVYELKLETEDTWQTGKEEMDGME